MSARRWRDRSQFQSSSPGPAGHLEKDSWQIRCRSQSQPAHACNAHTGTVRGDSLARHAEQLMHYLVSNSHTPNWDDILKKAHGQGVYLLSSIPLHILMHFPSPKLVPTGWGWTMHCTVVVQTRAMWMYIQSAQTLGAIVVASSFQPGWVYHP